LAKENELWQHLNALPKEEWDNFLDNYNPQSKTDFQAFTNLGTALETNAQFRTSRMKRKMAEGSQRFKQWSATLQAGAGFLKQGNKQLAEQYIEQAINTAHHPLFIQKNQNGTYDLIYEEAGKKSLMGDDITLEQAYQKAITIPAKNFVADFVAQTTMIAKQNREAGFTTWKKGDESYDVTVMYDPTSPNAGRPVVYKSGGGQAELTLAQLKAQGFRPEKLDDELTKQKIATSKASEKEHNAKANAAGGEKKRKQLESVINNAAKYFGVEGTTFLTPDGQFTTAGENTRMKAMEFYDKYKENPTVLNDTEYRKFNVAKALVGATNTYFGAQPKQKIASKELAIDDVQAMGGKKDKQGTWYIPAAGGKWEQVNIANAPQQTNNNKEPGQAMASGPIAEITNTYQPQEAALPEDATKWDVTMIDGSPVAILPDGQKMPLSPEQYEQWRNATGAQTSAFGRYMGDRKLIRTNKDYRPKENPFLRK